MATPIFILLVLGAVYAVPVPEPQDDLCGYHNCPKTDPEVLNVHIVAHTHDDVGWLKTVDQYYYGSKNTIQKAGVQYILDSVIKELWEDPKRKFIYVETAFFWKWWVRQSEAVQTRVRTLVREARLQFVGGAWSMNDEAAAHYHSTVDQFTWGLSKINETFGPCALPRVGWQIDPFGHAREFASLLAGMGYDGLFLGRIDFQDKHTRLLNKNMEMVWRGDDDLGASSDLFTGVLYNTYSPPPGFCFDVLCADEPIIDDPDSPLFNVDEKVDAFRSIVVNMSRGYSTRNVLITMGEDFQYQDAGMWYTNLDKLIVMSYKLWSDHENSDSQIRIYRIRIATFIDYVKTQSLRYRSNNVIITMGGDFTYQDAAMWYMNLDKLIEYTNLKAAKDGLNIKLFYSTPNCYLKAVKDANPTLPIKQDDFFPYASDPNSYWTGYFTSRPTTKFFERQGNDYLQMAKQLQVLAGLEKHNQFVVNNLKSAMGVMQHHDAITGTEKQHVTHDYERLLDDAIDDSLIVPRQAFNKLMQNGALKPPVFTFDRCRLNESSCYTSEHSERIVVTLYNPVAWLVHEAVRIPVLNGAYEVYAPNGDKIDSQLVEIPKQVIDIPTRHSRATHEVVFIAYLKPLMYKSFYIQKVARNKRDVTIIQPNKRTLETYENINEYWKDIQDKAYIDIKNIEDTFDKDLDVKIPEEPIKFGEVNIETIDLDVLKDKNEPMNDNVEYLDRIIKEAREKIADGARKRETAVVYPNLSVDEMRMLSDEPMVVEKLEDFFVMENENIKMHIGNTSGEIKAVTFANGATTNFSINYYYYPGCVGNNEIAANRSSGAYIFRPNATTPIPLKPKDFSQINGNVVKEIRMAWSDNVFSTARLYTGFDYIEIDWVVGPIVIDDNVGKEFIVKYETSMVNNGEFFTDSNGRQSLKRKLNERPQYNVSIAEPIGGNYYPVTNEIYIEENGQRLTIMTDRSQGGSSLVEGEIELMLHRRLLHDDAFGVGEALNETANGKGLVVRGTHRLMLSEDDHTKEKKNIIQMHLTPLVFVSDAGDMTLGNWFKLKNCYSWLKDALPEGIHLLTLEPWEDKLLIRLENYLSKSDKSTVEVDLQNILKNVNIKSAKEMMLSAYEEKSRKQWKWNTEKVFSASFNKEYGSFEEGKKAVNDVKRETGGNKIEIAAKEIKTFIVDYEFVNDFE